MNAHFLDPLSANQGVQRRGIMIALSSPSGAGKTTISREILAQDPLLSLSISHTTRPMRPNEVDGKDYHFIDETTFKKMIEDKQFLEHAKVFGHYYGTTQKPVEASLTEGKDVLFDIDWQGTQQISEKAADDIVSIFILPPSSQELERRLRNRGQDDEEVIQYRMSKASDEMSHWAEYHYVIINTDLEKSIEKVQSIILTERLLRRRQVGLSDFVGGLKEDLA